MAATGTSLGVGGGVQPVGQPVFDGTRLLWRADRADLSAFTGPAGAAARLRFRVLSDQGGRFDGFSIDSIRVVVFDPAQQPTPVAVGAPSPAAIVWLRSPAPNPARENMRIGFGLPRETEARLEVFDPRRPPRAAVGRGDATRRELRARLGPERRFRAGSCPRVSTCSRSRRPANGARAGSW